MIGAAAMTPVGALGESVIERMLPKVIPEAAARVSAWLRASFTNCGKTV
jgi:hypothetical protein